MKMKKLVALVCALSVVASIAPAYAAEFSDCNSEVALSRTVQYGDETFEVRYKTENGVVVLEEIDGNIIERIGNEIYVNGELAITVVYHNEDDQIQPRSGWIRAETWPTDVNPSSYNVFEKTNEVDLVLTDFGVNLSRYLLIGALGYACGLFGPVADIVGGTLFDYLDNNMEWQDSRYIYCMEYWYKNNSLPYTRRIDCEFYMNKNASGTLTGYIPDADCTVFASWG